MKYVEPYEFTQPNNAEGWNSPISLALGELITQGAIDFDSAEWDFDSFNQEQRDRLWKKFAARYYFRSIAIIPPARWRMRVIAALNEQMSKYRWLYEAMADGIDPLQSQGIHHKYRNINSEFPQTILSGNEDYASDGTDIEEETVISGDWLDILDKIKAASGIDELILDALEPLFSSLITVNSNMY